MSMTTKLLLSCAGTFIGGAGIFYGSHQTDPLVARFWLGFVMAGLVPLGTYFIGLAQRAPWEAPKP